MNKGAVLVMKTCAAPLSYLSFIFKRLKFKIIN